MESHAKVLSSASATTTADFCSFRVLSLISASSAGGARTLLRALVIELSVFLYVLIYLEVPVLSFCLFFLIDPAI